MSAIWSRAEQTLLATIESIEPIYAYFNVSERELLQFMEMLRQNELPNPEKHPPTLHLGLSNEQGYPHEGHLDFRAVGRGSGDGHRSSAEAYFATRTIR